MLRNVALASALPFLLAACTPMLSMRTDEQAWIEYMRDLKSKRAPASQSLLDRFPESSIRKILLSCNRNQQTESCYHSKALVAFDSVFKNEPGYKRLQQEFFTVYSYRRVFEEVQSFHQVLLSGMDLRASDHARELLQHCDDRDEIGVAVHSFGPYLGGDTDIPKSYYSCLNEELEKDEDQLLNETTERLGLTIVTPEARQWIRERQIHPVYEKFAHDWFQKQAAMEKEKWESERADVLSRFEPGESLPAAVKRLSGELRGEYRFLPIETYLTELHAEFKKGAKHP
jgi:hypothetical protein